MKVYKENSRILLRELLPSDRDAMFEMDSNPDVHNYLWQNPIVTIEEADEIIVLVRAIAKV